MTEDEFVRGRSVADELCGESRGAEVIKDGGGVFGADLDNGPELFAEEGFEWGGCG